MAEPIELIVRLAESEAWALAQMVKRIGWHQLRTLSVDDRETATMRDAVETVRKALVDAGVNPR